MREVERTWARVAKLWWAFTWRSVVVSWGVLLVVYLPLWWLGDGIVESGGFQLFSGVLLFVVSIAAQIWALRAALETDYSDFQVTFYETWLGARHREVEESDAGPWPETGSA